jgi:hypothetical protein
LQPCIQPIVVLPASVCTGDCLCGNNYARLQIPFLLLLSKALKYYFHSNHSNFPSNYCIFPSNLSIGVAYHDVTSYHIFGRSLADCLKVILLLIFKKILYFTLLYCTLLYLTVFISKPILLW